MRIIHLGISQGCCQKQMLRSNLEPKRQTCEKYIITPWPNILENREFGFNVKNPIIEKKS